MSEPITPQGGGTGSEVQNAPAAQGGFCPNCRAEYRPGYEICSDCNVPLVSELPLSSSGEEEVNVGSPEAAKCCQHSDADAVARCRNCSSAVCSTCDFLISGLHFCPTCIDSAGEERISPRRRRLATGAVAIAIYCTLAAVVAFSGVLFLATDGLNLAALGMFYMFGLYIPSLSGTAIACSAYEPRLGNTRLIWTALIWNSILTGFCILLQIIGLFGS